MIQSLSFGGFSQVLYWRNSFLYGNNIQYFNKAVLGFYNETIVFKIVGQIRCKAKRVYHNSNPNYFTLILIIELCIPYIDKYIWIEIIASIFLVNTRQNATYWGVADIIHSLLQFELINRNVILLTVLIWREKSANKQCVLWVILSNKRLNAFTTVVDNVH